MYPVSLKIWDDYKIFFIFFNKLMDLFSSTPCFQTECYIKKEIFIKISPLFQKANVYGRFRIMLIAVII